jgi:hypothetical protein
MTRSSHRLEADGQSVSTVSATVHARAFDTVVVGGSVAGVLDILDAFVMSSLNGGTPVQVLHAVASGVLGRAAYAGGAPAAALGLALHFAIAFAAATTYWVVSLYWPLLIRRPVLCGLAFGIAVWAVMYQIVLPITFGRPWSAPGWPQLTNQLVIHAVGVGLPIALFARRSVARQLNERTGNAASEERLHQRRRATLAGE